MGKFFLEVLDTSKIFSGALKLRKMRILGMVSVKIQCRIFYTIKNRSKNDVEKNFFLVFLKLFLELRYGSRNFKTHILPFYRSTIEI